MRPALLALLLAAGLAAPARAARSLPRCPDGSTPEVTGQPFIPWRCGKPPASAPAQASPARFDLPDRRVKSARDLSPWLGRWRGFVYYRGRRYEVSLSLKKKWRGYAALWTSMDAYLQDRRVYDVKLTRAVGDPGRFHAEVEIAPFPELHGDAWAGTPSVPSTTAAGLSRELVFQYAGRPDSHVVFLDPPSGDSVRFVYYFEEPGAGRVRTEGALTREK